MVRRKTEKAGGKMIWECQNDGALYESSYRPAMCYCQCKEFKEYKPENNLDEEENNG